MSARRPAPRWALALAGAAVAVAASRCSLIAGNFTECGEGLPACPSGRACDARGYCVVVPDGCLGLPDAGVAAEYGPDAGDAIKLGLIFNFTNGSGVVNASRLQQLNAALLALDEINQRGVGGGRRFAFQVCDTASNTALARTQAQWMADLKGVKALIVPTSGAVVAMAADTMDRDVLLMSPTATAKEVTALNNPDAGVRLVWRTAPSDVIQAKAIADVLTGASPFDAGLSGVSRVGIAYLDDPYGQGLNAALSQQLSGRKMIGPTFYARGGDLDASVATLDAFNPDVTVLIGFPDDVGRMVTKAAVTANLSRAAGHRWFFTDSAKDPASVSGSPAGELESNYGTTPAQTSGPAYPAFQSDFLSHYGVDPGSTSFIAHTYDAIYVVALGCSYAVGSAGTSALTGSRIAEGLGHLTSGAAIAVGPTDFTAARNTVQGGGSIDVQGASGQLNFDPATGEAPGLIELWQVDGGIIKPITVVP
ncbi:MAG TPA: ABC transporter substrate-binding protein [Myxococcaceae bacterium]|nr:ABC transporter substrate-binding protein [Myxococcaceae bacterium]